MDLSSGQNHKASSGTEEREREGRRKTSGGKRIVRLGLRGSRLAGKHRLRKDFCGTPRLFFGRVADHRYFVRKNDPTAQTLPNRNSLAEGGVACSHGKGSTLRGPSGLR